MSAGGEAAEGELEAVRKEFEDDVEALHSYNVKIVLRKSRVRSVGVSVQFPAEYPNAPLIVEVKSSTLPDEVTKKLEKAAEAEAAKQKGTIHLLTTLQFLKNIVFSNKFLSCTDEVKRIKLRAEELKEDIFKFSDKNGTIKIVAKENQYEATVRITVPDNYPDEGVACELLKTNFNDGISRIFTNQWNEGVRRLVQGFKTMEELEKEKERPREETRITTSALRDIKHDQVFLKQAGDMKKISENDKKVRRQLTRLNKKEAEAEREKAKADEARSIVNDGRMPARPSLEFAVSFFLDDFVHRLPNDVCQGCQKKVFPADPAKQGAKMKAAERIYCGHYFHFNCLDGFISTPPFGKPCPACGKKVEHPKFTTDVKLLEKRWASEQARNREIGEVADMLGL